MTKEAQTETIELTDREIAIASGADEESLDGVDELVTDQEASDDSDDASQSGAVDEEPEETGADEADGGDDAGDDDGGDEVAQSDGDPAAFSEADYTLGESYGLTREEVEELGSPKALAAFGRAYSKQFLKAPAKSGKQGQGDEQDDEQDDEQGDDRVDDDAAAFAGLDISKVDLDEYDEVTQSALKAIDVLQKKIEGLESERRSAAVQQQSEMLERFERTLDAVDGEFYGVRYKANSTDAAKISAEAEQRRIALAEAVDTLTAGYQSMGKPVPPIDVLVRDAHAITFREQVQKVQSASRKDRLTKQAARRRATGNRVSPNSRRNYSDDPEEAEIQRILEETEDVYKNMLEDNGA